MIGKSETGIVGDRRISWKNVSTERFDSKKFKEENEELYKKYVLPSTYRRFLLK
jgi:predicted phage-related endonuclease